MKYPSCVNWENRFYVIREKSNQPKGKNRRLKIEVICPDCKESRFVDSRNICNGLKRGSFTGRCQLCHVKLRGKKRKCAWRGGHHLGSNKRYMYITITPEHRFWIMRNKRNEVSEHRLVMATILNRILTKEEYVHHIDGNRLNNRPENLLLTNRYEHPNFHPKFKKEIYYANA